jgi:hypothetical protein
MTQASRLFFRLLVAGCIIFLTTCLAYCLPLEHLPPWFQTHGWAVLLVEVGFLMVLGLLSMGFDEKPVR